MITNRTQSLPLKTKRLLIRDFTEGEWESWYALYNLPETHVYNQTSPDLKPEKAQEVVKKFAAQKSQDPRLKYTLAIFASKTDAFIGYITLSLFDDLDEGLAEISYCLHPSEWGKGYATEAVKATLQFAFKALNIHRVEAGCSTENSASWKVLGNAGMTREGHIRQDMQVAENIWHDEFIYGILETDPITSVLL